MVRTFPRAALLLIALLAGLAMTAGAAEVPVPALSGRVVDTTATLAPGARTQIEAQLADLEARKGAQIAVLIVPTTGDETIEQYGLRVVERWKLGRAKIDDGALLLVAKNDRKLRIEVGYGLEGALNDATCKRIISDIMVPQLRAGDFAGAVAAGVEAMVRTVDGEPLPAPAGGNTAPADSVPWEFVIIVTFVSAAVLQSLVGRAFGAFATGGIVGTLVFILSQALGLALIAAVMSAVFALLFSASGGTRGWHNAGRGGFGGGSSFGGGGGFRGGGGGFGGGGASGSW